MDAENLADVLTVAPESHAVELLPIGTVLPPQGLQLLEREALFRPELEGLYQPHIEGQLLET